MRQTASYPDLYEVLGAPRGADPEELHAAYHARARDTADDPEPEQRLRELTDAYAILSKPGSRLLYDRLARGVPGGSFAPVDSAVGDPTADEITEREPIERIYGDEPAVLPLPEPRDERLVRYTAAAALVVSIVFLIAVLLA